MAAVAAAAAHQSAASLRLAVCGLHLRGFPLHWQLTELDATFVKACSSAPCYRLYALAAPATVGPAKPGMIRTLSDGAAVALEVFDLPLENVGAFISKVPPPLAIGSVELDDGALVKGFVCEGHIAQGGLGIEDITEHGGWAAYVKTVEGSGG